MHRVASRVVARAAELGVPALFKSLNCSKNGARALRVLAVLAAIGSTAWAQNNAAPANQAPDRASAYYHYTLAHMYAELGGASGNRDYISKAIDNYKAAIKADPQSSAISNELADLYVQTGRLRDAQSDAENALSQNPNDLNALRLLARVYREQISSKSRNQIDETMLRKTIEEYQKITTLAPKDVDSWLWLGRLQQAAQNSAESEKAFQKALEADPDNEDALTGLAVVYADSGETQKAADMLKTLTDKNPSQRSLQALAAAYEQMRQFGLAADTMKRVLNLNPPNATDVKRTMAEYLLRAQRYPEAIQTYQELVMEDPTDAQSYLRISEIYLQQHDFAKAREASDKAKSISPDDIQIRYNEVTILQAEDKMPEAIQALKDILTSTTKRNYSRQDLRSRIALLEQLANLYRNSDQPALAVQTYQQAGDLDPDRAASESAQIVETYRDAHDFTKAQQEVESALKKWPDDRTLHVAQAMLWADLGKTDQAASGVKRLLDGKNDLETYMTLAQVYDKARKWDDMGKALDAAEKLSGNNDEKENVYFMRGAMYERMKKLEKAESEFRKVLDIDPNSAAALNYLGYMLADRNIRLNEALDFINKALEKDPGNGAYLDSLGWVYYRLGRLPEAEDNLRRAVAKTPHDPTVHDHMGEVLMRESKVREAIAQWQISLKEWDAGAPADLEPAEVAKVKAKLESAKVRLAKETGPRQN